MKTLSICSKSYLAKTPPTLNLEWQIPKPSNLNKRKEKKCQCNNQLKKKNKFSVQFALMNFSSSLKLRNFMDCSIVDTFSAISALKTGQMSQICVRFAERNSL